MVVVAYPHLGRAPEPQVSEALPECAIWRRN